METADLRLLLATADGTDCSTLARMLGVGEATVRRRLRLMAAPSAGWLRQVAKGYQVTDCGQAVLGPAGQAVSALDHIARSLGVEEVSVPHVELVTTVAATGSIAAAARHLRLPQSSVSAKLTRVEQRWRTTLFVRTPAGVVPTPALHGLLPTMRLLEEVLGRLRSGPGDATGAPAVPAGLTLVGEFGFTGLLDTLAAEGLVDVRQHVIEIPGRTWTRAMIDADVCFYADLPLAALPVPAGRRTVAAFHDPAYVLLPPEVGAGRTTISMAELADQDWITGAVGSRNHAAVQALCQAAGFEPRVRFTALNGATGKQILRTHKAVALTGAALNPDLTLHAVRLAGDVVVKMTVGWRDGSTATSTAHRIARWLGQSQVSRLARIRPDLLAEMRAEPHRWPQLRDTSD
ncbi:MAG: hypothetical protein AVDCRST_MAG41-3337 [uncultured Corynebacteriales bacterium]|uniref:HTH lysR-type domain-containing protein n=1 Tax=uncultured Mycobacteriales bacterium TaxID=581187 RepID=A0A6J4JIS9_9ACTN|nr:MAG: hypothetical protein AVDCRST_MAG41-3337 [uncultured Corynebacteriales bacterium]